MTNALRTSADWQNDPKYQGITIVEADGWCSLDFHYRFHVEQISREEFELRLSQSTRYRQRKPL